MQKTATQQIIDALVELRDNTDQLDKSQGLQQIKELLDVAENEDLEREVKRLRNQRPEATTFSF